MYDNRRNMVVRLVRRCITSADTNAIVTSSNLALTGNLQKNYWRFTGRANVNGALYDAAGPQLVTEIQKIPLVGTVRCPVGSACITPATGRLRSNGIELIIHCVVPDGLYGQEADLNMLKTTFRSCFDKARDAEVKSLAFPALGCGIKGWPPAVSCRTALEVLSEVNRTHAFNRIDYHFLDDRVFRVWEALFKKSNQPFTSVITVD
mmetsp:Transcript_24244/g.36362  ORF Transcript_24244/g.36362 Transcript_24244/m.36362 type:complete len:206 (-) Transcript_24244:196-813(-)